MAKTFILEFRWVDDSESFNPQMQFVEIQATSLKAAKQAGKHHEEICRRERGTDKFWLQSCNKKNT